LNVSRRESVERPKQPPAANPGRPQLDLEKYVPGLLTVLYNRLSNESSKRYRKWYSLGVTDWRVLAYMGVYRESTAAQISRAIALDKAAISRSITLLKGRGLVDGKQFPGRRVGLQLTASGRSQYEAILSFALLQENALLSGFSDSERQQVVKIFHRMLHNMHDVVRLAPPRRAGQGGTRGRITK
jgi:DNA-binding MarR family transcriptional regulator